MELGSNSTDFLTMTHGGKTRQVSGRVGGASRDRTDDLITELAHSISGGTPRLRQNLQRKSKKAGGWASKAAGGLTIKPGIANKPIEIGANCKKGDDPTAYIFPGEGVAGKPSSGTDVVTTSSTARPSLGVLALGAQGVALWRQK